MNKMLAVLLMALPLPGFAQDGPSPIDADIKTFVEANHEVVRIGRSYQLAWRCGALEQDLEKMRERLSGDLKTMLAGNPLGHLINVEGLFGMGRHAADTDLQAVSMGAIDMKTCADHLEDMSQYIAVQTPDA
jgi:hypothetical protein